MQNKKWSIVEALSNTLSGMVIGYCAFQFVIAPLLGIPVSHEQNLIITASLTVISITRGYIWRRIFNSIHYGAWLKKYNGYMPKEVAEYEHRRRKDLERRLEE